MNDELARAARELTGSLRDYDALLDLIGDAPFVLLGEATHGTHEFYRERARITKRLIAEKGFTAVAVEGDWPSAFRVNRYVRAASDDETAIAGLGDFKRFPTWMWRNADVVEFVEWLREHNDSLPRAARRTGFYGLDLYSLYHSMQAVVSYLERADPPAARRARARYACFDHFAQDSQQYGYATAFGTSKSCQDEVVAQLVELQRLGRAQAGDDDVFDAEQNARLVKNAEEYYRSMFSSRESSWNLRDAHRVETLEALAGRLSMDGPAKIVVWEHNSHVGDARATEMGQRDEWTVGQLMRERHGPQCVLVGMTTYRGTVTAASDWDAPAERKRVRDALPGSYEQRFHDSGIEQFLLTMRGNSAAVRALGEPRLERAIGVVYLPETERYSHYFRSLLAAQFDAVLHWDQTRGVEPLERTAHWEAGEAPQTYPVGV
jgi:erythromycin esterase-like protein